MYMVCMHILHLIVKSTQGVQGEQVLKVGLLELREWSAHWMHALLEASTTAVIYIVLCLHIFEVIISLPQL